MIISAKPLRITSMHQAEVGKGAASPTGHGFGTGGDALHFAIAHLVDRPVPRLLVPALFCQSALEGLAGAEMHFYDCTADGQVDGEALLATIETSNIDVVIINHLFGAAPEWRVAFYQRCKAANILVIDDMCHCPAALFASDDFEGDGEFDVRIFSFRKFLPVPAGGAAQIHPRFGVPAPVGPIGVPLRATVKIMLERLIFATGQKWLWRLAMRCRAATEFIGPLPRRDFAPPPPAKYLPPHINAMLADRPLMTLIADQRRQNFDRLQSVATPLNDELNRAAAPQNYAIDDHSGRVKAAMEAAGIACFGWPAGELPYAVRQNAASFPNAVRLADRILCLPIHQDVTPPQIEYIASTLGACHPGQVAS
jgi:dTDP-4-amino-4,6-dideoxygalactose transaminase